MRLSIIKYIEQLRMQHTRIIILWLARAVTFSTVTLPLLEKRSNKNIFMIDYWHNFLEIIVISDASYHLCARNYLLSHLDRFL